MTPGGAWLAAGATASTSASLLHLGCIAGGPRWFRFFGAGERIARAAERGLPGPALFAFGIAAMLAVWAAYAWSGAGLVRTLPLLKPALVVITAIYLARGMVLVFPGLLRRPDLSPAFLTRSSAIVLVIGLVHAVGLWRAWPHLNGV